MNQFCFYLLSLLLGIQIAYKIVRYAKYERADNLKDQLFSLV